MTLRAARCWTVSVAFHAAILAVPVGIVIEEHLTVERPLRITLAEPRPERVALAGLRRAGPSESSPGLLVEESPSGLEEVLAVEGPSSEPCAELDRHEERER